MFEDDLQPNLNNNDLVDDVSEDDVRPPPSPLSRNISDINAQVGIKGWKAKFNIKMIVQVVLSIFYAIVYGISFAGLNPYYAWPLDQDSTSTTTRTTWTVGINSILTNEEYFQCEDKTLYANETGPLVSYESTYNIVYDNGASEILKSMGAYWGISIAFFIVFVIIKLYSGKYNQLIYVVSFKEDDNGVKPAKLSFAYTIMCNAKTFSNVVFMDLCDRIASPTVVSPEGFSDWLNLIFLACWALIMLWIFWWIFTCGECCGILPKCILDTGKRFRWFRILVICNTVIIFLTWIANFNLSLQFNPSYPLLLFTNVVSWIDLIVSFIGDIYLKSPNNCDCCRKGRGEAPDIESPPSGTTDEDTGSDGTPPTNHCKPSTSNSSKTPSYTKENDRNKPVHPAHESVKETIYGDGTRSSVKTTVFSDGSKKVVETCTAAS